MFNFWERMMGRQVKEVEGGGDKCSASKRKSRNWRHVAFRSPCSEIERLKTKPRRKASYRMLLLFHIIHGAILEGPLHYVGFWRSAFFMFAAGELGPEMMEFLKLDEMPNGRQRGGDDSGFGHGSRGGDGAGHDWGGWCDFAGTNVSFLGEMDCLLEFYHV